MENLTYSANYELVTYKVTHVLSLSILHFPKLARIVWFMNVYLFNHFISSFIYQTLNIYLSTYLLILFYGLHSSFFMFIYMFTIKTNYIYCARVSIYLSSLLYLLPWICFIYIQPYSIIIKIYLATFIIFLDLILLLKCPLKAFHFVIEILVRVDYMKLLGKENDVLDHRVCGY